MDRSKRSYWEMRGAQVLGPPTPPPARPSDEDIASFEACVEALAVSLSRAPEVLILGFTRSVVSMRWPAHSSLTAIDWSGAMIHRVWPRDSLPRFVAPVIGDWREMPLPAGCFDLVIGDGCFASLDSFADCAAVTEEAWRVLRPGGRFVQRCFSRPDAAENVDRLLDELQGGRIPEFEQFRWRLAMALHPPGEGIVAADVWREWRLRVEDPRALCARLGWNESDTATFGSWRDQHVRVPLPTRAEMRALTERRFDLIERREPSYGLGRCFPILVLQRRP